MSNHEERPLYGAEDIKSLEGVELVRARPSLFLDGLDSDGLHRLVFEAIDNAVDEFRAGAGDVVTVSIDNEGVVEVSDKGRGVPQGTHRESGLPVAVFLMTKSFAGAKFEKGVYNNSGGLHGVGLKCINAFSDWVELSSCRNNVRERYKFIDGVYDSHLQSEEEGVGTTIKFLPNYQIFGGATLDRERICSRLEDSAYLNPGLRCVFSDGGENIDYYAPNGVKGLLLEKGCLDVFSSNVEDELLKIECHLGTDPHGDSVSVSYANGIPTPEGGSHVSGVKTGVARALNSYAGRRKLVKESDPAIGSGDVSEGCYLVVSLVSDAPPFSSQKKTKIVSPEIETRCASLISGAFLDWLESNPNRSKHVVQRSLLASRNREKLRALKARLRLASKTKKLKKPSCVVAGGEGSHDILICVKNPRWRTFVAEGLDVLPLFAKTTTPPARTPLERLLKNPDFFSLAATIGGGVGSVDDDPEGGFRLEACRYQKITIIPGESESAMLAGAFVLSFIEHHLSGLIEEGRVFWKREEEVKVTTGQSLKSEIGGYSEETDVGDENGVSSKEGAGDISEGGEDPGNSEGEEQLVED